METQRKLWLDQNNQPPKCYLWYKNGSFWEWINGRWQKVDIGGSGGNCECSSQIYTEAPTDPKEGDMLMYNSTSEKTLNLDNLNGIRDVAHGEEGEYLVVTGSAQVNIPVNATQIIIEKRDEDIVDSYTYSDVVDYDDYGEPEYGEEITVSDAHLTITDNNSSQHAIPSNFSAEGIEYLTIDINQPNLLSDLVRIKVISETSDVLEYYNGTWLSRNQIAKSLNSTQGYYDEADGPIPENLKEGDIVVKRQITIQTPYIDISDETNCESRRSIYNGIINSGDDDNGQLKIELTKNVAYTFSIKAADEDYETGEPDYTNAITIFSVNEGTVSTPYNTLVPTHETSDTVDSYVFNTADISYDLVSVVEIYIEGNPVGHITITSDQHNGQEVSVPSYWEIVGGELVQRGQSNNSQDDPDDIPDDPDDVDDYEDDDPDE